MKTSVLLFPSILLFNFFAHSQENKKLDSLLAIYDSQPDGVEKIETLNELYYETFHLKRPEDVLPYVKEQLSLSRKLDYKKGEGDALFNYGNYYRRIFSIDSARYYFEAANDIWKVVQDNQGRFNTLNGLAKIEQLTGNFDKAIALYDEVMKIALDMKNGLRIAETNREIATIYMDQGSYKLGLKYMLDGLRSLDSLAEPDPNKRADLLVGVGRIESLRENFQAALKPLNQGLEIFSAQKNHLWECITHTEIGYAHLGLKNYDESIRNFNESLKISISSGRKGFESICYYNLGLAHRKKGNLEKAQDFLYKSIKLGKTTANNNVGTYNELGNLFLDKGQLSDAQENYTIAIQIADSIGSLAELKDGYMGRSLAYEKANLYSKALEDKKKYQELNDSIFSISKAQQIEELRAIYETEKKEQQIALQEKEITVLEQKAEISTLQKILLGGLLVLSLIGFYGIRQKLKRNRLEKEKVDAELAFKKKELTTHALHLAKKNEVLENVKLKAKALREKEGASGYKELIKTINFDQQDDKNWESFTQYFEQVHKDFAINVKKRYPDVTKNELRFMALMKMNMSSKEIATILNISTDGIKKARQRLRKKMNLNPQDSLENTVLSI